MNIVQVQAAAEQGFHIALVAGLLAHPLHEVAHARVAAEVQRHVVLRLATVDAQVAGQAERAHAVHQAEVDRLGGTTFVRGHFLQRAPEHLGGGVTVHVGALLAGAHQARVLGQVGHDPQLDLRIVGRQQLAALRRHERAADAAAVLGADRDVLQVRVRRGEAAGGGTGLVVAGVHAAGVRVDHLRQLVGVGTAQLGQAAVLQDHPRQLVLLGNRLQRLFIGAGLALGGLHHRRQLQLIEQHRLQLLGRIQVEAAPGQLVRRWRSARHWLRCWPAPAPAAARCRGTRWPAPARPAAAAAARGAGAG
ncbi:hypothetical protein G6F63_013160 [Rhizopus arrhizus]|nr:hypothetical protein G6F63_013160 [Rhizopus arrhizus]